MFTSPGRPQENVGLYIHSAIRLHGIVLTYLSKGTTLPLPYLPKPTISYTMQRIPLLHTGVSTYLHAAARTTARARNQLQPPAHAGSSLADFTTLKMEAIPSSEMSVHTRSTRRHIPEDGILHSHRRENPKSYTYVKFL
jgi:hypothetical protein